MTIVIASWDYSLYALTPDGKKLWAYATGNVIPSSPAIAPDGTIYVGSYDKLLHAVASDGNPVWTAPLGDYVGSTPAIAADGTVYIGSYKSLYAIDKSGKKLGTYPTGQSITYGPQIYGDTVFFYSDDLTLYALGKGNLLAWKSYLGNAMGAAALTFDGALVFPLASFTAPEVRCLTPGRQGVVDAGDHDVRDPAGGCGAGRGRHRIRRLRRDVVRVRPAVSAHARDLGQPRWIVDPALDDVVVDAQGRDAGALSKPVLGAVPHRDDHAMLPGVGEDGRVVGRVRRARDREVRLEVVHHRQHPVARAHA